MNQAEQKHEKLQFGEVKTMKLFAANRPSFTCCCSLLHVREQLQQQSLQ